MHGQQNVSKGNRFKIFNINDAGVQIHSEVVESKRLWPYFWNGNTELDLCVLQLGAVGVSSLSEYLSQSCLVEHLGRGNLTATEKPRPPPSFFNKQISIKSRRTSCSVFSWALTTTSLELLSSSAWLISTATGTRLSSRRIKNSGVSTIGTEKDVVS